MTAAADEPSAVRTAVAVAVATIFAMAVVTPPRPCGAAYTTAVTTRFNVASDGAAANGSANAKPRYEGSGSGADNTVYAEIPVADWNETAAADYVYEDYDSSSTVVATTAATGEDDALPTSGYRWPVIETAAEDRDDRWDTTTAAIVTSTVLPTASETPAATLTVPTVNGETLTVTGGTTTESRPLMQIAGPPDPMVATTTPLPPPPPPSSAPTTPSSAGPSSTAAVPWRIVSIALPMAVGLSTVTRRV